MGRRLIIEATKSCGCSSHSRMPTGRHAPNYTGCGNLSGSYWNRVIKGAKDRNFPVEIDIKFAAELLEKQNGKCALSGMDISFERSSKQTASLDRIDSKKGYFSDNVQWVHKRINKMKWDFKEEKLHFICEQIAVNCCTNNHQSLCAQQVTAAT